MTSEAKTLSLQKLTPIYDTLRDLVDQGQFAGMATQVAQHGDAPHRWVYGRKNIETGEPLAEDTIFRIFSMTKPITGVAMMILHDRGLWLPEDPIAKHLPEFEGVLGPNGAPPAQSPKLLHLMTHTAGFGYGIGYGPFDATDTAYREADVWGAANLAEFSRRVASVPLATEPGDTWRYSLSMDLQGAMIERLTGRGLADFLREEIFEPLGMVDTDFYVPTEKRPRLASLYHRMGGDQLLPFDFPGLIPDPAAIPPVPLGGGGLYSTLSDYSHFAQTLLNKGELNGRRVMSPEAVALMTTNHLPNAIIERGVDADFQKIGPGRGYAFNGAVFFNAPLAGASVGTGSYQWDGATGVWFWIDPENDLYFVGLVQRIMDPTTPPLQRMTQDAVGAALV